MQYSNKVNVSDIKNNLTSTDTNKPLSANQGKLLNENISKLSNGENVTYSQGTSVRNAINDIASKVSIGKGQFFSFIITGDNWYFGFISKYSATQYGGCIINTAGSFYKFNKDILTQIQ